MIVDCDSLTTGISVNALYRASPISTADAYKNENHELSVNALYRASPISTQFRRNRQNRQRSVSMPYIGLLPFLRILLRVAQRRIWCQCPISGFSHFYLSCFWKSEESLSCVNALYRASPISTGSRQRSGNRFYLCVNALYRASPISTHNSPQGGKRYNMCVNALYRASPISTIERKRIKMRRNNVSMPYIGLLPFLLR